MFYNILTIFLLRTYYLIENEEKTETLVQKATSGEKTTKSILGNGILIFITFPYLQKHSSQRI